VTRGPSYDLIRAAFQGRAAHAGVSPESAISAIMMAARAIAAMPLGRIDSETTANVGRIFGGTTRNVVPELVELEGEARSLNSKKINRQVESMREIMESAARESGAAVRVQVTRMYDGFQIKEDEPPVVIAAAAARAVGLTPIITSTGGGTDAHELNAKGLPSIILSMGAQDMHSKNEHIRVADLVKPAEWIGAIVIEAGLRKF